MTGGVGGTGARLRTARRPRLGWAVGVAAAGALLVLVGGAGAAASFAEGFENLGTTSAGEPGPRPLVDRGWSFRNQSSPKGSRGWFGLSSEAFAGFGALGVNHASTVCGTGAQISNWAVLPAVPGQAAGDALAFAVRGGDLGGGRVDRVQVRYSPSGGTSTGSNVSEVGDFTQLLLDWQSPRWSASLWTEQRVTLPGSGRIAFRYYVPDAGPCTSAAYLLRLDALTVGGQAVGPVPLPQPGQTVVWPRSASPVTISGRTTIPAGGTVVVEPGVEIRVAAESTLVVAGTLRGAGTTDAAIRVTAPSVYPPALEVTGTLDLAHAAVGGQVRVGSGSTLLFADSTFAAHGTVTNTGGSSSAEPAYVQVERSRFEGVDLYVGRTTVVLRDVAFQNANAIALDGQPLVRGVTVDGGRLALSRDGQPVYVDEVTVTNSPGAGLELGGANYGNDFLLGPSVVLTGNEYPVWVNDGGLLPGSNVPATGNARNAVLGDSGDARGPVTWANVGVPYEVPNGRTATGSWRILPGVTVRVGAGAGLFDRGSALQARGTVDAPITFERLDPFQPWYRFDTPGRLEHAIVDGSAYGLIYGTLAPPRFVDSSVLRGNGRAAVGSVVIRGTRFLGNTTGASVGATGDLNGATNPNSFVGNGVAVANASDARSNWWGDPSGPASPDNPKGTGDAAAAGVPFSPFRTTAPNFADSPPTVKLRTHAFLAEPGTKVPLSWTASDDGSIARQRLLFSREGDAPSQYSVLAELPAGQRTYEWTVPEVGFQVTGGRASIRVEAFDDAGQVGWDAWSPAIPSGRATTTLTITSDLRGPFRAGSALAVCYTGNGDVFVNSVEGWLFLDGDRRALPLGGMVSESGCLGNVRLPFVSTDAARIGLKVYGSTNDFRWTFSEPFAIRPDARVGDAAPTVTLTSPLPGQTFAAGAVVPVSWTAADDEALRGFELQVSTDGGRSWHEAAGDLPAVATSVGWQTPAGAGLGSVRLRLVARDLRFQHSSATVAISVGSGSTTQPPAPPATTADTVSVQVAEYRTSKRTLRVEATSTRSDATLTVRATATGALIGTLASSGDGRYSATFTIASAPSEITVTSNRGGSATATVTQRK